MDQNARVRYGKPVDEQCPLTIFVEPLSKFVVVPGGPTQQLNRFGFHVSGGFSVDVHGSSILGDRNVLSNERWHHVGDGAGLIGDQYGVEVDNGSYLVLAAFQGLLAAVVVFDLKGFFAALEVFFTAFNEVTTTNFFASEVKVVCLQP